MFKLVSEKTEEPEIKLPTSTGSSKKQESFRKDSDVTPVSDYHTGNLTKIIQVRKQQLELDMEQQTGSK